MLVKLIENEPCLFIRTGTAPRNKNETLIKKVRRFRLTAQKASLAKAVFSVVLQLY